MLLSSKLISSPLLWWPSFSSPTCNSFLSKLPQCNKINTGNSEFTLLFPSAAFWHCFSIKFKCLILQDSDHPRLSIKIHSCWTITHRLPDIPEFLWDLSQCSVSQIHYQTLLLKHQTTFLCGWGPHLPCKVISRKQSSCGMCRMWCWVVCSRNRLDTLERSRCSSAWAPLAHQPASLWLPRISQHKNPHKQKESLKAYLFQLCLCQS